LLLPLVPLWSATGYGPHEKTHDHCNIKLLFFELYQQVLMKPILHLHAISLILIVAAGCLASGDTYGQQARGVPLTKDVFTQAESAIRKGDAKALSEHLGELVELNFIDEKNSYSKTQAEFVLRDFFSKYPAESFHYDHKTTSESGLRFTIGTYTFKGGGQFRVHMLLKKSGSGYMIDMIDFTKEERMD